MERLNFYKQKNRVDLYAKVTLISALLFLVVASFLMQKVVAENIFSTNLNTNTVYATSGYWLDDAVEPTNDGVNYAISTPAEFAYMAKQVNTVEDWSDGKTFNLVADIDLSEKYWTPIGYSSAYVFRNATFNGNEHTINGLTIDSNTQSGNYLKSVSYVGLFGFTDKVIIKDFDLTSVNIQASSATAAVIGKVACTLGDSSVTNINVDGNITGVAYTSGVIGWAENITVENVSMNGTVTATSSYVGGIAGACYACSFDNCFNGASVSASAYVGGIVGDIKTGATSITDCYNVGDLTTNTSSKSSLGGIVGKVDSDADLTMSNVYSVGLITASNSSSVGAIVGNFACDDYSVSGAYYLENIVSNNSETSYTGEDNVVVTACTSAQLQEEDTFINYDFTNTWEFIEGENNGYPTLQVFNDTPLVSVSTLSNTNGSITGSSLDGNYKEGDVITLTATPNFGYNFFNWTGTYAGTLASTTANTTYTVTADDIIAGVVNLTANFEVLEYTVTYNLNGGENSVNNPTTYTVEDGIVLEEATKEGYTFVGWEEGNTIEAGTAENLTFTANWDLIEYIITYADTKDVINTNPTSYTIESEEIIISNLADVAGYTFIGWAEGNTIEVETTGNLTFTANWDLIEYTITYADTKDVISTNPTSYTIESDEIIITDLENVAGYIFTGFDVTVIPAGRMGDITITASWDLIEYTITYANTKGAINTNVTSYTIESDEIIISDLENVTGYTFVGWEEGNTIEAGTAENLIFTANYEQMSLTLTIDLGLNGSVAGSSDNGVYYLDNEITLIATADENYRFVNWTGAFESALRAEDESTTYTITLEDLEQGTLSFTANFELIPVVVNIEEVENGDINGLKETGEYTLGEEIALTAVAVEGYEFAGWSGTYSCSNTNFVYVVTQEDVERGYLNVTATFTEITQSGFTWIDVVVIAIPIIIIVLLLAFILLHKKKKNNHSKHRRRPFKSEQ